MIRHSKTGRPMTPAASTWALFPLSVTRGLRAPFPAFPSGAFSALRPKPIPRFGTCKDKVVIIAYEPAALQDIHSTPYSLSLWKWPGTDMSGAEVHANIVETLLTGRFPRPVPAYLSALYLAVTLLIGGMLFYRLSSWQGLAVSLLMCLLAAALAYILFRRYWLLPTANVQLAVMLSYMGILGLRLTGEERERARIRNIFGRYVADEVVEKLLATGMLPDLGGDSLQVTVLFSDIRNFTTISERLGPQGGGGNAQYLSGPGL